MNSHRGDDDIAFFAANLGLTHALMFDTNGANLADAQGPLKPGRYLVQLRKEDNGYAWVSVGKWERGNPIAAPAAVPAFPMSNVGLVAVEFHVREGVNDRIAARTESGSAVLYITLVSYGA